MCARVAVHVQDADGAIFEIKGDAKVLIELVCGDYIVVLADGGIYNGRVRNNVLCGPGTITWPDGRRQQVVPGRPR